VSRALRLAGAVLFAVVAVAAAVLFFQSRDDSTVDPRGSVGDAYTGEPVLSPGLEDAVARGNVVILYRQARPPDGVQALREGAGPELREDGLAVLLEREPTLAAPLAAVSADRIQTANEADGLREFVDYHLGRAGAP
jgi:hypothetical protein